ncbi:MAG: glycosyltransferase family 4 protein [Thaumarchaeota archaeon]|nr:glycosyltransferase family 4 protein [Nitrososphaerota archaeon]
MGGAEVYVSELGSKLIETGHEVHWLTSKIPDTNEREEYRGISMHRVPILFSSKYLFPGRQTFPLTSLLNKLMFVKEMDVVQANTLVAGYSGWRVAKRNGKPSLLFCHEFFGDLWSKIGRNAIERKMYPKMEKRIARSPYDWFARPSEYSKSTLIDAGAPEDRITVIPHGIDHALYNTSADGSYFRERFGLQKYKLFGYLGRLRVKRTAQSKNLPLLLEAAKIVCRDLPDARLVLAGAGFEELEPLIRKLDLTKSIVYVGDIPYSDNARFLKMCDAVVCPAVSDGFCFLSAQAQGCGVPVVASDAGSHKERVTDSKSGYISALTPDSIADSVERLLSDSELAAKMGKAGSDQAMELLWEKSALKHLEVYENLRASA